MGGDSVNIADLPPGWWVFLGLPDGRLAIADAENPEHASIVAAIRSRDVEAVTAWMDDGSLCPRGSCHCSSSGRLPYAPARAVPGVVSPELAAWILFALPDQANRPGTGRVVSRG